MEPVWSTPTIIKNGTINTFFFHQRLALFYSQMNLKNHEQIILCHRSSNFSLLLSRKYTLHSCAPLKLRRSQFRANAKETSHRKVLLRNCQCVLNRGCVLYFTVLYEDPWYKSKSKPITSPRQKAETAFLQHQILETIWPACHLNVAFVAVTPLLKCSASQKNKTKLAHHPFFFKI